MITFLEIIGVIVFLYLLTQVFLPLMFPSVFEINWLFKKNKSTLKDKAKDLKQKKTDYVKAVDEVKKESKQYLEDAKQTNQEIKQLK